MKCILFVLPILLLSCNSVDKSNPEAVVKAYLKFLNSNDSKSCYELISTKSKELATYDEFKRSYNNSDSIIGEYKVEEQEKELNNPTFKRFKISETFIEKDDTSENTFYYTLINENNEWKRVWNGTIQVVEQEKYEKGDYDGAISLCNKAIELNPFDGTAYDELAWCYMSSNGLSSNSAREETLNKITSCLKHAISLEPDVSSHYNSISAYYSDLANDEDLSIEYLKQGLDIARSKDEKVVFLANIGQSYFKKADYILAKKYLNEALLKDPHYDFALYNLGGIYNNEDNFLEAIKYFGMVNKDPKLPDNLKSIYYYYYAVALKNSNRREESKGCILKALELSPSNENYKTLYEQVK